MSDKSTLFVLFLGGIISVVLLGVLSPATPSALGGGRVANTVDLPILVYPQDGLAQYDTTITVDASDVSSVDSLYFQMHQPFWHVGGTPDSGDVPQGFEPEGAAEVRVNSGQWIEITDGAVNCAKKETKDGCVAAAIPTIRFSLPADTSGTLSNGTNNITFRYNGTKGVRSGYRVLGVGFMTSSDPNVRDFDAYDGDYNGDGTKDGAIDNTTFNLVSTGTFSAPSGASASNGETLWNSDSILTNGHGESIAASCSSCHFENATDLQYFGYENRVIIARAQFHRLSKSQGADIAAYVRSQDITDTTGTVIDPPGRPWSPPFQPGPEMRGSDKHPDEGDETYWMAGAGLEWVFDSQRPDPGTERDILAHIFPKNGDPANGVARYPSGDLKWTEVHPDSTIDMRAIPLQSQLPDWNNWLPDIHPLDFDADYPGSKAQSRYQNEFQAAFGSSKDVGNIIQQVSKLRQATRDLGWPKVISADGFSSPTKNEKAMSRLSAMQWKAKVLVDHAFDGKWFKEAGQWNCGYESGPNKSEWLDYCEGVQLPGGTETVFRLGPHVNGTYSAGDIKGYGTRDIATEMTHQWYQLQTFMDPGVKFPNSVDWNYQNAFLPDADYPFRSFVNYILQNQIFSNKLGNDPEAVIGRKINPSWFNLGPKQQDFLNNSTAGPSWDGLSEATTGQLVEAYWRSWWAETKTYDVSTYPRTDGSDNTTLNDTTYGPEPGQYAPPFEFRTLYYWEFNDLAEYHENEMAGVIDSMATYLGDVWPLGNDRSYMDQYGSQYPLWDSIATAPASGDFGPSSRSVVWGDNVKLRHPGSKSTAPNSLKMKPAQRPERPVGGNINYSTFYVAAPPSSTPDSAVEADVEAVRSTTAPGQSVGWESRGGLALASDTSSTATACEIRVRGGSDAQKAAIRTYITDRSTPLSSKTWYFAVPLTLRQYYRGGYCVQEVNGTLIDSAAVTLPDSSIAVLNVVNDAQPSDTTTAILEDPSDFRFIKQE